MAKAFLFIDARVKDWQFLLTGASSDVDVVFLNADADGIGQIRDTLHGNSDVPAFYTRHKSSCPGRGPSWRSRSKIRWARGGIFSGDSSNLY